MHGNNEADKDAKSALKFEIVKFKIPSTYIKGCPNKKRSIVNYSLLNFKTMVLWNFDLLWKTMVIEKTMVL